MTTGTPSAALRSWRSLRLKIVILLAATATMTVDAAVIIVWSLDRSRDLVDRSQAAQTRIKQFLLLAGRVSDYSGIASLVTEKNDNVDRLEQAHEVTIQVFDRLRRMNGEEVEAARGDGKSAAATKGLQLARMRAQFEALHRFIAGDVATSSRSGLIAQRLNAFGVTFAPMLASAVETERQQSDAMHLALADLRKQLVIFAWVLAIVAFAVALLLYLTIGRPLLSRIDRTLAGAREIAAGRFETRLDLSGDDELTGLMAGFNDMAARLDARERDVILARQQMQETIRQRTASLRDANTRLAEIDASWRRFFADISHELRTPLTVIQGEAEFNLNERAAPTKMR